MGIRIKLSPEMIKLKDFPKNVSKRFARDLKDELEGAIQDEMMSGNSPVRGHKWPEYSESYAKRKGFKKPNLFLTGKMLKSLSITQTKKGTLQILFKDEKAKWHNDGEGYLPQRKMLPSEGESFNVRLTKLIRRVLVDAVKKMGQFTK